MSVQVCRRCVMDSSADPNFVLDENGFCNYCTDALIRKQSEYFPDAVGREKLDSLMKEIRADGAKKQYDCVVGVSGGVDSTYVLKLGYDYGLRMLTVHVDDGLDTDMAKSNIEKICSKTNAELTLIKPDLEQYKDITLAFFKAGLPNVAIPQDNIILQELINVSKKYDINTLLSGGNFAMESILQTGNSHAAIDLTHIRAINRRFGTEGIDKLNFISMTEKFFDSTRKRVTYRPLNYIDYNMSRVLLELQEFADYQYYGGKHHESILTRFMQCYYLPVKFKVDKRKSHFSSLIVSGQMSRDEALDAMKKPLYPSDDMLQADFEFLADYFGISHSEFRGIIDSPAKSHADYPRSKWNSFLKVGGKVKNVIRKDRK